MSIIRQIFESFRFAWNALKVNILRTVLSLLGVTVGIFSIIGVFTFVDSFERNIQESFEFLGSDVLYVQKQPFIVRSRTEWFRYFRRPTVSYTEYKFLEDHLRQASSIAIFADKSNVTAKFKSNSITGTLRSGSYEYNEIFDMNILEGRYFTRQEIQAGRDVVIVGAEIYETLFPRDQTAIGKTVKINNRKYTVIGVMKKEGESFLGTPSNDEVMVIPYASFRKMYQTGTGQWNEIQSNIGLLGLEKDEELTSLESEVTGLLRSRRGLKPKEETNFSVERPEAIGNMISGVFDIVSIAGAIIGGFAMLVGGFGIANIMFVSVQERISIIGLQKSVGAKNYVILFQFLFESIFLSIIGGMAGLVLIFFVTLIPMGDLDVIMSFKNIVIGLVVSASIGIISGIIPALRASRLDPVVALRS